MSSPDVNMNYIKSLLFLDVCIEIVTVKHQSVWASFTFLKFGFMCVSIFLWLFYFFPSGVWFIVTVVIFVACTFVTCFNKDQSINQFQTRHIPMASPLAERKHFCGVALCKRISENVLACAKRTHGFGSVGEVCLTSVCCVYVWCRQFTSWVHWNTFWTHRAITESTMALTATASTRTLEASSSFGIACLVCLLSIATINEILRICKILRKCTNKWENSSISGNFAENCWFYRETSILRVEWDVKPYTAFHFVFGLRLGSVPSTFVKKSIHFFIKSFSSYNLNQRGNVFSCVHPSARLFHHHYHHLSLKKTQLTNSTMLNNVCPLVRLSLKWFSWNCKHRIILCWYQLGTVQKQRRYCSC